MSTPLSARRPGGRPPLPPAQRYSADIETTLQPADAQRLDSYATAHGLRRSEAVRRAILDLLDRDSDDVDQAYAA